MIKSPILFYLDSLYPNNIHCNTQIVQSSMFMNRLVFLSDFKSDRIDQQLNS